MPGLVCPLLERVSAGGARWSPPGPAESGRPVSARAHLLRGGDAGQRPLPDGGLPARPEPGDPGGGARAAPVLHRRRVSAAPAVPRALPPEVRRGGEARGDPDREWLPAGPRPERAGPAGPRRLRGDRGAELLAGDPRPSGRSEER